MATTANMSMTEGKTAYPAASRKIIAACIDEPEFSTWDRLVASSPQGTVFCSSWWLRALDPEIRLLGYFEDGRLVAGMPLYFERRGGLRICSMPQGVPYWGVIVEALQGKPSAVISREMHVLGSFAEALSHEKRVFQTFHPNLLNWLPFYWAGFQQTLRFTYRFEDLSNLQSIWARMDHSIQLEIRKAERQDLRVVPCDAETVFNAERMTFQRKAARHKRSLRCLQTLYSAAKDEQAGECFAVVDGDGRVHTACMLVWNSSSAFPCAGGADPQFRKSGAISFLMWQLIQFSASRAKAFDFGGSMIQGIEHFNRSFGAKQVPYHCIYKFPILLRSYLMFRNKI